MGVAHTQRIPYARFIFKLALRSSEVLRAIALMRRDTHSVVLAFGHADRFALGYGIPVCAGDVPFFIATRYSQLSLSVWELVIEIAGYKTSTVKREQM